MDFFDRQEAARKTSKRLVVLFALAVIGVSVAIGLIVSGAGALGANKVNVEFGDARQRLQVWNPMLFLGASGVTVVVILLGSLFKTVALGSGGPAVAKALGGRKVDPNTTDADERKLLNVVEEMSIASGIPVPDVYLMDAEHGINAFAAGRTTSDAVIGATRGCVKMLSRDELQGVVAHEFSHILNGDMRLNLRLMGLLFGIIMITVMGRIIMRSVWYSGGGRSRNSKDGGGVLAILAFGIALIVVGYLGVLAANLIKAAVSRQREFLADASAVQFTRNPDGIAGALKKIGGLSAGSRMTDAHAEEASHMFFACGLKAGLTNALSTHPPLQQRIKAIDPSWDGKFPRVSLPDVSSSISSGPEAIAGAASGLAQLAGAVSGGGGMRRSGVSHAAPPAPAPMNGIASVIATATGAPSDEQVGYARQLYQSLPEAWRAAAHNEAGAQALIFAMLLAQDDDLRGGELAMLERELDHHAYNTVMSLYEDLGDLAAGPKIALIDLSIPALRRLSPDEYDRFRSILQRLVVSDGRIDLFEFMLEKIVRRHLDIAFNRTPAPKVRYRNLARLEHDAAVLISTLARLGVDSEKEAQRSFAAGVKVLAPELGGELPAKSPAECRLERLDEALERFEQASAPVKRSLLLACSEAVMHDGVVAGDEAELLRAIADSIDAPIPPLVMEAVG